MAAVGSAQAEQMKKTPIYTRYAKVAPHPEQFPLLLDRMGELMRKDYDWRPEIAKLPMPTLLLFADHDAVSTKHIAEFFALFGGGVRIRVGRVRRSMPGPGSPSCRATRTTISAKGRILPA